MNGKNTILVICSMILCSVTIGCINESNENESKEIELHEENVSKIEYLPSSLTSNFSDLSLISKSYNVTDFRSGRGNIIVEGTFKSVNSESNEKLYTTVVSYPIIIVWADFYDKNQYYLFSSNEMRFNARYDCTEGFKVGYSDEMEWIKKIAYIRITIIRTDPSYVSDVDRARHTITF